MPRYNPLATPTIDTITPYTPAYLTRPLLMELHRAGGWRRTCSTGGLVQSIECANGAWARSREAWGPKADLEAAIAWWTAKGMRAPSSPAGLVMDAAPQWYRFGLWSLQAPLLPWVRGGWQEAQEIGHIPGPHRVYDLRKAYRWSVGSESLPLPRSCTIASRWSTSGPGLHALDLEPWAGACWPLTQGGVQLVQVPEDLDLYGEPPLRSWCGGIRWTQTLGATPLTDVIDAIPCSACARAFWGPWIADTPVTTTWASGKKSELWPRTANAVWGHLVLQRVRRRLAAVDARYRYVDSVILPAKHVLPVGTAPGEWRVVREYDEGIWIGWPGAYGPSQAHPDKQAGIKRSA